MEGAKERMRKKAGVIIGLWLLGAVFAGSGCLNRLYFSGKEKIIQTVQAASSNDIQKRIDEVNRKKKEALEEKEQLEKDIEAIEKQEKNVLENIEFLDGKMAEISRRMENNKEDISKAKKEIKALRKEKEQAEEERKKQYDIMSKRIRYMYENGSSGYLELLLGADSLSELFNRAEYVSRVTDYDNNLVLIYQEVCDRLEKTQDELNQNLQELEGLRENLKVEEDSVQLLLDKKSKELDNYKSLLREKSRETQEQENLLQKQEEELERLLEEQRRKAEQEARERAEKEQQQKNQESRQEQPKSPAVPEQAEKGYRWPLPVSGTITSYFGYRTEPTDGASTYHKGIDISVPVGTAVLAARAGTVITAAYSTSAGNYIALYHGDGVYSYYMHCSSLSVGAGEKVSAGHQVALSGNTGISTGPHLHFAIYANGVYVNPLDYVSQP